MDPTARTLNESEALEQLEWLRSLAAGLVLDPASADDLVQETWLASQSRRPVLSGPGGVRAWLAAVLHNLARRQARSERRRREREQSVARAESFAVDVVARGELQRELASAVMALEEPERSAVLLRYLDGLSALEVARRQGVSHAAARKRISRGLARLRERLDESHGGVRAAWLAPLQSWISAPSGAGAGAGVILGGSVFMLWKLSLAAAVVLALSLLLNRSADESPVAVAPVGAPSASGGDSREANTSAPDGRQPTSSASAVSTSAAALRLLDERGAPRQGFAVLFLAGAECVATASSDAEGLATSPELEFDSVLVAASGRRPEHIELRRGEERSVVIADGASVSGAVRATSGVLPSSVTLEDDTPLVWPLTRFAPSVWKELERLGVAARERRVALLADGAFCFTGLDGRWSGRVGLPSGWSLSAASQPGVIDSHEGVLLLAPAQGLDLRVNEPLRVTGRVVDSSTRAALAGAQVRARLPAPSQAELSERTNAEGEFVLAVPHTRWAQLDWAAQLVVEHGGVEASRAVRVRWEELERRPNLGEFELDLGRRVRVVVRDESGAPLTGAEVRTTLGGTGSKVERTDAQGFVLLAGVAPGPGFVIARADGHAPAQAPLADEVEITLFSTNRIDVRVRTHTGGPVERAQLELSSPSFPFRSALGAEPVHGPFHLRVGVEDGVCVFSDLLPGAEIELQASVQGVRGVEVLRMRAPALGERAECVLELSDAPTGLCGRVVDESGRGIPRVSVLVEVRESVWTAVTDAAGEFTLEGAPAQGVLDHVEATHPAFAPFVATSHEIDAQGWELVLARGRCVEVVVSDADRRPLQVSGVMASFAERPTEMARLRGTGELVFEALPRAEGRVHVSLGGVEFSAPLGPDQQLVRLELPPTGELEVQTEHRAAASNARIAVVIQALDAAGKPARQYLSTEGDKLAPWRTVLAAGRYRVQLEQRVLGRGKAGVENVGAPVEVEIRAGALEQLRLP